MLNGLENIRAKNISKKALDKNIQVRCNTQCFFEEVNEMKKYLITTMICLVLMASGVTSVMAVGGFEAEPRVADNGEGLDAVFSPNASPGIEDKAVIGFTSTGVKGDYQVIVDTHGAGGVGPPDGDFEADGDWSTPVGEMIGGKAGGEDLVPQIIRVEWDGTDRAGSSNYVTDGTYKILVQIDYKPNGVIDKGDPSYDKRVIEATVDNTPPQIAASALPFSPNGDGKKDTTTNSYQLSEDVLKLELTIQGLFLQPTTIQEQLKLTGGVLHEVVWDGKDGLGIIVKDGSYNCILKGIDSGGNFAEYFFSIQVDTEPPAITSVKALLSGGVEKFLTISGPIPTLESSATIDIQVEDEGGSDIDFLTPNITLRGPSSQIINLTQTTEFPDIIKVSYVGLVEEGIYTLEIVSLSDKAGNALTNQIYQFRYENPLVIERVSPEIGQVSGGDEVTITGNYFQHGATVTIGGNPATEVVVDSETQITANTPQGELGITDVTVTNHDGQSSTLSGGFAYIPIYGDVSGNGTVSAYDASLILRFVVGLISEFPVQQLLSPEQNITPRNYTVSIPKQSAKAGSKIQVPIVIDDATGLFAGGISISYDASVLKAVDALPTELLNGSYWKANVSFPGEVRFAFAKTELTQGSGSLLTIEFQVLSESEGRNSPLSFSSVNLSNSLSIGKNDGLVNVQPAKTALLPNYPNPFNPETWIPYKLSQDAPVAIYIYSSNGQLVRKLDLGHQSAGVYVSKSQAARWDGKDSFGQKVASGVYYYTLRVGGFRATRKMVIFK
jgi:flagellar hook assembly protein FlgD